MNQPESLANLLKSSSLPRLLLSVVILSILVFFAASEVPLHQLGWHVLIGLLLSQPLIIVGQVINSYRIRVILHSDALLSFPTSFRATTLATGLNAILPGRFSELIKVTFLKEHAGINTSWGFAAVVTERIFDLIMLSLLLLFFIDKMTGFTFVTFLGGSMLMLTLLLMAPLYIKKLDWFTSKVPLPTARVWLNSLLLFVASHLSIGRMFGIFALSITIWGLSIAAVWVYLLASSTIEIGIVDAVFVLIAGTIGASIAILPGGIGTFHAATTAVLVHIGHPLKEALILSLGLHLIQFFVLSPYAMLLVTRHRLGISRLIREANQLLATRKRSRSDCTK